MLADTTLSPWRGETDLPDLLLCTQVGTFVAELLQDTVARDEVFGHTVTLDVDAGVLVVEVLVPLLQVLTLPPLNDDLFLNHTLTL